MGSRGAPGGVCTVPAAPRRGGRPVQPGDDVAAIARTGKSGERGGSKLADAHAVVAAAGGAVGTAWPLAPAGHDGGRARGGARTRSCRQRLADAVAGPAGSTGGAAARGGRGLVSRA